MKNNESNLALLINKLFVHLLQSQLVVLFYFSRQLNEINNMLCINK